MLRTGRCFHILAFQEPPPAPAGRTVAPHHLLTVDLLDLEPWGRRLCQEGTPAPSCPRLQGTNLPCGRCPPGFRRPERPAGPRSPEPRASLLGGCRCLFSEARLPPSSVQSPPGGVSQPLRGRVTSTDLICPASAPRAVSRSGESTVPPSSPFLGIPLSLPRAGIQLGFLLFLWPYRRLHYQSSWKVRRVEGTALPRRCSHRSTGHPAESDTAHGVQTLTYTCTWCTQTSMCMLLRGRHVTTCKTTHIFK